MSITHLYRYLSVPSDNDNEAKENEKKIFHNKELHLKLIPPFRDEAYLNDPYDLKVNLYAENTAKKIKMEHILITSKLYLLSFSEKRDDILMWSHYAKKHTGYCLEFDFKILQEWIGKENLDKVEYEEDFVIADDFCEFINDKSIDEKKKIRKVKESFLLRKSFHWKNENEWRIVLTENDYKKRNLKFPEEILTGVIFGFSIKQDEITRIRKMLDHWVCKPKFYQALAHDNRYAIFIRDETPPL